MMIDPFNLLMIIACYSVLLLYILYHHNKEIDKYSKEVNRLKKEVNKYRAILSMRNKEK